MISKMTEPHIICGDTQIPTEKDSSVLKWFQRPQSFTSFEGRFSSQLRKTAQYRNDYKNDRTLHSLLGHSSFKWKKLTSFIGTFKIQLEKTVQYPNDFKDDRTSHYLWDTQIPTEKDSSVLKWFQRPQSFTSFEGRFSSQTEKDSLVSEWLQRWQNLTFFDGTFKFRLTEPHIFCWDIQIQLEKTVQYPNNFKSDRNLHRFWGHSNSNWKI